MSFKISIAAFLSCVLMYSCQKNEQTEPEPTNQILPIVPSKTDNKLVLNSVQISSENTVKLTWNKLDSSTFQEYQIIRKLSKNDTLDFRTNYDTKLVIKTISNPNITSFTDVDAPLASFLGYQVLAIISDKPSGTKLVYSNNKTIERPDIKFVDIQVFDFLSDIENNRIFTIEPDSGRISILNMETATVEKSVKTNSKIGNSCFGQYKGRKELYVPRNDGWIYVYDPLTLDKTDQISCGSPASSVIFNDDKLFVTTSDRSWFYKTIKVIDRATKKLIATDGNYETSNIKLIPGTNTELIEISRNISPTQLAHLKFDNNLNTLKWTEDTYHDTHPLDPNIFSIFPNGRDFITSNVGAIYSKDLVYKTRMPHGNYKYSDFSFKTDGTVIYAGCGNERAVISYSTNDYTELKKYTTKGFPVKIFLKGNTIYCLSSSISSNKYNPYNPYLLNIIRSPLLIEKIIVQ